MKKRKSDITSGSIDGPTTRRLTQDGHLRAAMESVFRRTHGRDMTEDEKRVFGLLTEDDSSKLESKASRRATSQNRDDG